MSIRAVTRELLVRCIDTWAPGNLHAPHGAAFLYASARALDHDTAEAAVRAFAEFADRLRRPLTLLFVAPGTESLRSRLADVQREWSTPAEMQVHVVPGGNVPAVLKAAGAGGGTVLAMVDDSIAKTFKASVVLAVAEPGTWRTQRQELQAAGLDLTAGVELVDGAEAQLIGFGTRSAKSLEAFKGELWSLDEYAGVRYRDPRDPESHLMDISLDPNPGALRRELLQRLTEGALTVTELKRFALTDTVYRAADAQKVIAALLHAGTVHRTPPGGRLGGDVLISLPPA
ncbi:hypothetical protein [Dactylosporangium matsuzakiense]|uniref:Uncharacterized protein n=1 Tax=Dactylosporangium matsuzakiense TaxID=53360 RepID=A0A9W6NKN6_9ACTN|nr:hypothetical protein [Dactylosporangium matsuzakiense]UWZ45809.1 hypothetical protein Dmats_04760 [Dactylosporangium matsuzakiense]GLL00012.1 hypothetical protein GCM10017581_017520 [Dactylosporangium matsuzakiense]